MTTQLAPEAPVTYRESPTAAEALDNWFRSNPEAAPVHTHPWDVSRSDIYVEDRWGPVFAEMRRKAPVNKVTGTPFGDYWSVTTVKTIQDVEALPDLFSSSWRYGGITIGEPQREVADENKFQLPMFIAMDRPQHTGQRRTIASAFTPSEMERMTAEIRQRTAEVLDSLPWGQQFDWVARVSVELTTDMLAILFGFPWCDRRLLTFWSDWSADVELTLVPELVDYRNGILREVGHYFTRLWNERANAAPTPDLISMMIHSPAMNQMSFNEFVGNLVLLIAGGNDTTRNTMSGFVHALDRFPEQRRIFETEPGVIPNAVQETIRYVTPIAHMRRTATEDTDFFGTSIAKGDKIVLWYISANRDETVFDNPDVLDLRRENARRHLSFGYGMHRCVGARLAELQLRILMEEMHQRRMRVHVTGKVERVRANFAHGHRKLEVELEKF